MTIQSVTGFEQTEKYRVPDELDQTFGAYGSLFRDDRVSVHENTDHVTYDVFHKDKIRTEPLSNWHPYADQFLSRAKDAYQSIQNPSIKERFGHLIDAFSNFENRAKGLSFNPSNLPLLHPVPDVDSMSLEWIFDGYRIGFHIEDNENESSWTMVSTETHGDISASGNLPCNGSELTNIVHWLTFFVLNHTKGD